jgi:formylmethanofuran dehydrogenase subunit E
MISLKEAAKFHGHLGPYLVLGILAGDLSSKKLKYKKYFGLEVKVWGANKKPKSCLIDGLQLSTGATFGKGNIHKFNGPLIKIEFCNKDNNKRIVLELKDAIKNKLVTLKGHSDSEEFARKLYKEIKNGAFRFRYL